MDQDGVKLFTNSQKKYGCFFLCIEAFYEFLIEKHNMNINDVEISILASVSKGYTIGQILEAIEKVITIKHENKYSIKTCTATDFIPILGRKNPIFIDEENKIKVKKR